MPAQSLNRMQIRCSRLVKLGCWEVRMVLNSSKSAAVRLRSARMFIRDDNYTAISCQIFVNPSTDICVRRGLVKKRLADDLGHTRAKVAENLQYLFVSNVGIAAGAQQL